MKKFFVLLLLIAFIATMINAATPRDIRLTWSGSVATTQTISWTTDSSDTATHKLRYRKVGVSTWTVKTATSEDLVAPDMTIKIKSVALTALTASTSYQYQVSGDNGTTWIPSAYYTFKTGSTSTTSFKFIVFGDTSNEDLEYSGDDNTWAENLSGAFARNTDANFFVNVGDIVDKGQMYTDWAAWIGASQSTLATKNAMMTVAKDECNFGEDYAEEMEIEEQAPPVLFPKLFKYPQNGPTNYKGIAYSYDYGNVHIVSIPNQLTGYYPGDDAMQDQMFAEIKAWLIADLAATTKTWKIVIMHLNMYTTMSDRSAVKYRADYNAIFEQYNVDVVFDGHVHTVARTYPVKNGKFVASPLDATVYYTVGMGAAKDAAKEDVSKKIWHAFTFDGQTQSTYLTVEVDGSELEVKCFLQDGTEVDEYQIDKSDVTDCTTAIPPPEYDTTHMVVFGQLATWWDARLGEWEVVNPYIGQEEDDGEWVNLETLEQFPFQDNINEDDLIIPDFNGNGQSDWYIDVRSLSFLMNGDWDPLTGTLIYDDMELFVLIPPAEILAVTFDNGQVGYYVSEKGLREATASDDLGGFLVDYDEDLNLVFIERFRD